MYQDHAFGLVRAFGDKIQGPVQRGITTTENNDVFSSVLLRIANAIGELAVFFELCDAFDLWFTRLKRTNTTRDKNRFGDEVRARSSRHIKAAIFAFSDETNFLTQVKCRLERLALLEQARRQLLTRTHGNRGNIVNRFVGIQLNGLTTCLHQRVDYVRPDLQQAQFKHLKQADGTRTNNDGIGFDGATGVGDSFRNCRINGHVHGRIFV